MRLLILWLAGMALALALGWSRVALAAPLSVRVHLRGGDRISGWLVSGNTNQVVVSNVWAGAVSIPLTAVLPAERTNLLALLRPRAVITPANKHPEHQAKIVRATETKKPKAVIASLPHPVHRTKGIWHGQANVGLDAVFNTVNSQDYSLSFELDYDRPDADEPTRFFRNKFNVDGEYQRSAGQESANRADASNKSDFDLWKKTYGYTLEGVGFDEVQGIDFEYQLGPGGGIHLVKLPKFALNFESGLDYQEQYRRNNTRLDSLSVRVAEDATWNLRRNLTLTENEAFYPDLQYGAEYRDNFTSTLSYGFWKNLSLNLTVNDNYQSQVVAGVSPNRFEVQSSLGVSF